MGICELYEVDMLYVFGFNGIVLLYQAWYILFTIVPAQSGMTCAGQSAANQLYFQGIAQFGVDQYDQVWYTLNFAFTAAVVVLGWTRTTQNAHVCPFSTIFNQTLICLLHYYGMYLLLVNGEFLYGLFFLVNAYYRQDMGCRYFSLYQFTIKGDKSAYLSLYFSWFFSLGLFAYLGFMAAPGDVSSCVSLMQTLPTIPNGECAEAGLCKSTAFPNAPYCLPADAAQMEEQCAAQVLEAGALTAGSQALTIGVILWGVHLVLAIVNKLALNKDDAGWIELEAKKTAEYRASKGLNP
jgi:hypothetical protein